jgi:hypothetical protein
VSYALGAVGVPFRAVAIGTLAMFPHMLLTVYLGVAAAHVVRMAGEAHTGWTIGGVGLLLGFVVCAGAVLRVSSLAWREIRAAQAEEAPDPAETELERQGPRGSGPA